MLPQALELWRSRLQSSELPFDSEGSGYFESDMLAELNNVSEFLERIIIATDLEQVRAGLDQVLSRKKPGGLSTGGKTCSKCGRPIP